MCLKRMISAECSANIFRAISHFTTLRVTQTAGKRWCSVVPNAASHCLPTPPCPSLSLPCKLGRHGFGFQRLTKGLLGFTSGVESIAFNGSSTAPRYLCVSQKKKKKWLRKLGQFHSPGTAWEVLDCDGKSTGHRIKNLKFSPSAETKGNYIIIWAWLSFVNQHSATDSWLTENELWIGMIH